MKAVIVAAGLGSRLASITDGTPKCLIEINGMTLIERALDALEQRGVRETTVVVGHQQEAIRQTLGDRVSFLVNPFYKTTNNMASLWLAAPHVWDTDFLYLHADVAFHPALLDPLLEAGIHGLGLLVDPQSIDEEAMKVRLEQGRFKESSKEIPLNEAAGEWTGLTRFTPRAARSFHAHAGDLLIEGHQNAYDTAAFNRMAKEGIPFTVCETKGLPWIEIDTPDDLEEATRIFEEHEAKEAPE
jgi:L-glutamine-phosphate cytidylyltransferase